MLSGVRRFFILVALLSGLVWAPGARAGTINVNSTAQSPGGAGNCTLGEAIQAANTDSAVDGCSGATAGSDTIVLPAGKYTLTAPDNASNGLPIVTSDIILQGAGAATTTIERAPMAAMSFRIFQVDAGSLTLNDVTVRGGSGVEGGGILISGTAVTLNDSVLTANSAGTSRGGGASTGTMVAGQLTLNNSTVSNNTADQGGGLFVFGTLTISGSTVARNTAATGGGSIHCGGTANISNTAFNDNSATTEGGALAVTACGPAATANISSSTFARNASTGSNGGGALSNTQTVNITDSIFSSNQAFSGPGAAIRNAGTLTVTGSTLNAN
ncbi:MAG: hypothetical protein HYY26_06085, partial [Acidobacteria bacterium]|nr:hypothetical protein [Acidobacteriota bacterium]